MKYEGCSVILLAAGKSYRFSRGKIKKQFFKINNKTLLEYCLDTFHSINSVKQIIIVADRRDFNIVRSIIKKYRNKKIDIANGGKERYNSVQNAVKFINKDSKYVLIHDVARPLVSKKLIMRCLYEIQKQKYKCVIPGLKVVDTTKIINENSEVETTIDRNKIVLVQTPQVFQTDVIRYIYSESILKKWSKKCILTDDSQLAELEGIKIKVISGEQQNIKVTTKEDIPLVKLHLNKQ